MVGATDVRSIWLSFKDTAKKDRSDAAVAFPDAMDRRMFWIFIQQIINFRLKFILA